MTILWICYHSTLSGLNVSLCVRQNDYYTKVSCYLDERRSSGGQGPSEAAPPSVRTPMKLQEEEELKSCSETESVAI